MRGITGLQKTAAMRAAPFDVIVELAAGQALDNIF
jgi:hypothetical protein